MLDSDSNGLIAIEDHGATMGTWGGDKWLMAERHVKTRRLMARCVVGRVVLWVDRWPTMEEIALHMWVTCCYCMIVELDLCT